MSGQISQGVALQMLAALEAFVAKADPAILVERDLPDSKYAAALRYALNVLPRAKREAAREDAEPIREGYGVRVRERERVVQTVSGPIRVTEWQVWKKDTGTKAWGIVRRYDIQRLAEEYAAGLRACRKKMGVPA